ncbi:MAG: hypothetical protein IPL46_18415 [Saprospiraceae bacterium]|nr:hypothetical protein [Saprospiraceae bacterium]
MLRWSIPYLIVNICWSLPLISQIEPIEWAPIGAKWWYNYTMGVSDPSIVIQTMESIGDTVILNKNCRILKNDVDLNGDGNLAPQSNRFIYQNGDTVFYYNDVLNKFSILYNLAASNGDTLLILEPDIFQGDS